jgi:thermitase
MLSKVVIVLGSIALITVAAAQTKSTEPESIAGQYVVALKKSALTLDRDHLERSLQGKIIENIRPDMVLIQRDQNESSQEALANLRQNSVVELADPNYIYRATRSPNDPDYKKLWGLNNTGEVDTDGTTGLKGVDVNAEKAWGITTGSKNVLVAVIDTGVDFKIPDLKDNAWTNKAEASGKAGADDDGNGYVDDIHGYNFVGNNGDSTDDNEHGSHVAGTIGAQGDNGTGVAGLNWNVSIMAVKFLDSSGGGSLANAIKAVDYARKMGAKIMNNSWGGPGANASTLRKAIEDSKTAGALFVAAGGNSGYDNEIRPEYPASFKVDNIVSVAAIDNRGALAEFSNFGANTVHLAAPGVNIISTIPSKTSGDSVTALKSYSGTSMAAPHVSGVAALLLAKDGKLTYRELKDLMIKYSRPLVGLKYKTISGGAVDAYYALTRTLAPLDPNDPSAWTWHNDVMISTPHPYPPSYYETFTVHAAGAKRIAVHFAKFETESIYDKVQFLNGQGKMIATISGDQKDLLSPVIEGDAMMIRVTVDNQTNKYGFDIDKVYYEK